MIYPCTGRRMIHSSPAWASRFRLPQQMIGKAPPNLYTAIQEQIGLKLEPPRHPADVMVIDHVEKPSEN